MASLALSGHFPPDRLIFLEVLAQSLARRSRLRALSEGVYPGADLVILYEWEGLRLAYRVPAEVFVRWSPYLAAHEVQSFLWKEAIARLHRAPDGVSYAPTAYELSIEAGLHRRQSRRR